MRVTKESRGVTACRIGGPGRVPPDDGMTVVVPEAGPAPTDVTAFMAKVYCAPLIKPPTMPEVPVTAGLKAVNCEPFTEYW